MVIVNGGDKETKMDMRWWLRRLLGFTKKGRERTH